MGDIIVQENKPKPNKPDGIGIEKTVYKNKNYIYNKPFSTEKEYKLFSQLYKTIKKTA